MDIYIFLFFSSLFIFLTISYYFYEIEKYQLKEQYSSLIQLWESRSRLGGWGVKLNNSKKGVENMYSQEDCEKLAISWKNKLKDVLIITLFKYIFISLIAAALFTFFLYLINL